MEYNIHICSQHIKLSECLAVIESAHMTKTARWPGDPPKKYVIRHEDNMESKSSVRYDF